jgi:hypothetical protein
LTQLAQARGIEIKLITADEAYHDKDKSLYEETGVTPIKPFSADIKMPENVDPEKYSVTLDDM